MLALSRRSSAASWPSITTDMCSGSEVGSYLRLMDFCITRLESNKEEDEDFYFSEVCLGAHEDEGG